MLEWSGPFCSAMALTVIVLLATVDGVVGHFVRKKDIGRARPDLGAALIFLLPVALWAEASGTPPHPLEVVVTTRVVNLSPVEARSAAAFIEDVLSERSTLLGLALPTPIGATGREDRVRAIVQCVDEKAIITKQMTEVMPGKVLAFDVVEQRRIEDRSAALRSGAFHSEKLQGGRTRVILQSTMSCAWMRDSYGVRLNSSSAGASTSTC